MLKVSGEAAPALAFFMSSKSRSWFFPLSRVPLGRLNFDHGTSVVLQEYNQNGNADPVPIPQMIAVCVVSQVTNFDYIVAR